MVGHDWPCSEETRQIEEEDEKEEAIISWCLRFDKLYRHFFFGKAQCNKQSHYLLHQIWIRLLISRMSSLRQINQCLHPQKKNLSNSITLVIFLVSIVSFRDEIFFFSDRHFFKKKITLKRVHVVWLTTNINASLLISSYESYATDSSHCWYKEAGRRNNIDLNKQPRKTYSHLWRTVFPWINLIIREISNFEIAV